jgi:hypothetical protein
LLLNDRPQKADLGLVLSLANSPTYKAIEIIPLMVFCQKIIGSRKEKISLHHTMPKALRPLTHGILVEESINRRKQELFEKRLAKISIQSNLLMQLWRVRQTRKGA